MHATFKVFILVLMASPFSMAQSITLAECYEKARANYPLIKQKELVSKSLEYSVANVQTGYLPQLSVNGQATYQSDVTRIPGGASFVEPLSKDQYKIYLELNQAIYDGGITKKNSAIQETSAQVEDQKIEVELYKIKDRINQIYFGALLINEQQVQNELVRKDLEASFLRMESAVRNGIAFRTNADILQAEILKIQQRKVELNAARKSYLDMLGMFIHEELSESTILQKPDAPIKPAELTIARPEISLYNFQGQLLFAQQQLSNTRVTPRISLFAQGGYGRPGLNMLLNEFNTYYLGGIRLSWNLGGYYNSGRDRQLLDLNLQSLNQQRETFVFNTNLSLRQQNNEITKLNDLLQIDEKLIDLRTKIKNTAKAQLDNGVITANDYLRELNAEDQAKQNLLVHQIQLLMTQYSQLATSGN
ncbi:MAG: TolC family protein [Cyclobacteriaceae bacterium]|nr:TolC family protein [Cyclobacteriaceae bacterium]